MYSRKYEHGMRVNVVKENLEGCTLNAIISLNIILVAQGGHVRVFDDKNFQEIPKFKLSI